MTWAATIRPDPNNPSAIHAAPVTVDLAYLVVPSSVFSLDGPFGLSIYGVAIDSAGHDFVIDVGLPEPATMGIVAFGSAALLCRRRQRIA